MSFRPAAGLGPGPADPAHLPAVGSPGWSSGPGGGPACAAVVSLQVSEWVSGLGGEGMGKLRPRAHMQPVKFFNLALQTLRN